jgi:hypothetical protein
MPLSFDNPLWIFIVFPALMAVVLLIFGIGALRHKKFVGGTVRCLSCLLLLSWVALLGLLSFGAYGYQALTAEQHVADVAISQLGNQRFRATVTMPDGERRVYNLAGDQFFIDARILKWRPFATLLGFQTGFELDRIGGRYIALDDELSQPRTVFSLTSARPVDTFALIRRFAPLQLLADAEYGSATFTTARDGATYAVSVSTTGLLVRQAD